MIKQLIYRQRFGVVETSTATFGGAGTTENLQNPPANTSFWPCPRGAFITMENGSNGESDFHFSNNKVTGPSLLGVHCDGKYKISGNQPGGVVLETNAGTNKDQDNAFNVKLEVTSDAQGTSCKVTGTAMTHKSWGQPAGSQNINDTAKVTQKTNKDGSTTYSTTIDAVDDDGKKVELIITWTPYHPC